MGWPKGSWVALYFPLPLSPSLPWSLPCSSARPPPVPQIKDLKERLEEAESMGVRRMKAQVQAMEGRIGGLEEQLDAATRWAQLTPGTVHACVQWKNLSNLDTVGEVSFFNCVCMCTVEEPL